MISVGQEYRTPAAVLGTLDYFYRAAFDAKAEITNEFYANGKGVTEFMFVGKHIGDFAGIPATGKMVNVPMCVVYHLKNDKISSARVYFEMPVLMQQLGVMPAQAGAAG